MLATPEDTGYAMVLRRISTHGFESKQSVCVTHHVRQVCESEVGWPGSYVVTKGKPIVVEESRFDETLRADLSAANEERTPLYCIGLEFRCARLCALGTTWRS